MDCLGWASLHTQLNKPTHTQHMSHNTQMTLKHSAVKTLTIIDVETCLKLREHRGGQPVGKDVDELGIRMCRM
jgi:hypothetical protein